MPRSIKRSEISSTRATIAQESFSLRRSSSLKSKFNFHIFSVYSLAEELLSKESIGLPDIIRILGDRPFPMKENVKEYLHEMLERKDKEDKEASAAETPADAAANATDQSEEKRTEQGEALSGETPLNIPKEGEQAQSQKDQEKKE